MKKTRRALDTKRAQLLEVGRELKSEVTTAASAAVERSTTAVLGRFGIPSKSEIRDLIRQVSALTAQVERMNGKKA